MYYILYLQKRRKSTPILPVTNANNPYHVNSVNNEPIERKNISQLSQTKFPLSKLGQKGKVNIIFIFYIQHFYTAYF